LTTLYIKTHNKTNLKYFGKTQKMGEDIEKYYGSGIYWLRHLRKYGFDISTEIYACFEDDDPLLEQTAIEFSRLNNIVESKEWANLIEENGLCGNPRGIIFTEDHLKKLRSRPKRRNYRHTEETKQKISKANSGNKWSEEQKKAQSKRLLGHNVSKITRQKISKMHAGKIITEETKQKISKANKGKNKGKTYKEIYGSDNPGCGFKSGDEHVCKRPEVRKKLSENARKNNCAFTLKECYICHRKIGLNNFSRHYAVCKRQFLDDDFWEEW
jgi:hypothetical protein